MINFIKRLFGNNIAELQDALLQGAIIIDVRMPAEYKSGAVKGSKNIPLNEIKSKVAMIKKWNKPIITVCQSGNRSMMALSMLKAAGIETHNGGAWTSVNKIIGQ